MRASEMFSTPISTRLIACLIALLIAAAAVAPAAALADSPPPAERGTSPLPATGSSDTAAGANERIVNGVVDMGAYERPPEGL